MGISPENICHEPVTVVPNLNGAKGVSAAPSGAAPAAVEVEPLISPLAAVARQAFVGLIVLTAFLFALNAALPEQPSTELAELHRVVASLETPAPEDGSPFAVAHVIPVRTPLWFETTALYPDFRPSPAQRPILQPVTRIGRAGLPAEDGLGLRRTDQPGPVVVALAPTGPSYGLDLTRGLRRYNPSIAGERPMTFADLQLLGAPQDQDGVFVSPPQDERFDNVVDVSLQGANDPSLIERNPRPMTRAEGLKPRSEVKVASTDPTVAPTGTRNRIVVHFNPDQAPTAAQLAATLLRLNGYETVELRAVDFDVPESSTRFFHAEDGETAEEVRALLSPNLYRINQRDFTHYQPRPSAGLVEVWIAR